MSTAERQAIIRKGGEKLIERKIYNAWAFTENAQEKAKMNYQLYKEDYEPKIKRCGSRPPSDEEMKKFTCFKSLGPGYAHTKYKIISNPHNFSTLELALICDGGNLCFGYRTHLRWSRND